MSTFEGLGLHENLLQAVTALGYTQPTPIQEKAIPVLLSGTKDLVGLAQTGTGKTAAFGLPLLHLLVTGKSFSPGPGGLSHPGTLYADRYQNWSSSKNS